MPHLSHDVVLNEAPWLRRNFVCVFYVWENIAKEGRAKPKVKQQSLAFLFLTLVAEDYLVNPSSPVLWPTGTNECALRQR